MKLISIIGATGSIGTQALDIIRAQQNIFKLQAFSAHSNLKETINIINEFKPSYVAITEEKNYKAVMNYCKEKSLNIEVLKGMEGLIKIASLEEVSLVLTSIVGMIGLQPTLKAIECKKDIALANKETLVVAGELVMAAAKKHNVKILPVDSEHNAIFQCLMGNKRTDLEKIILTASGGPFRNYTKEQLEKVSIEDALNHPNWSMGKKITIDSATLMNKGLEVIEAKWLFDVDYKDIQVVVHPQSIIHSMVEYKDGSVIAQLGPPDMRLPIQFAFNYPEREKSVVKRLDFYSLKDLSFQKPDMDTFKCLKLAFEAGNHGKLMPTILNAANEVCVELFLNNRIGFLDIGNIIEECMVQIDYNKNLDINTILETDLITRNYVRKKYL